MAYSYVQLPGNGSNTNFGFSFGYLSRSHIGVKINDVPTAFTWLNDFTVQVSPAPANGTVVEVRRITPKDQPIIDWSDGSTLTESDMDLNSLFALYCAQEAQDAGDSSIQVNAFGQLDAKNRRIINLADPVGVQDAVNRRYFEDVYTPQLDAKVAAASSSAAQAQGYAAAADASADTAATLVGLFKGQYLGAQASDPTVDGNGQPVTVGDLYFSTTSNTMKVYTGSSWVNAGSTVQGTINKPAAPLIASAGQTSVTVPGGYDPQFIVVFVNGSKISPPDIDVSSGSNIGFSSALSAGDEVDWVAFGAFSVANTYTKAEVDARVVTVNVKSFGAKGDGTTNDSVARDAAIAALGSSGGTLFFPKGSYILDSFTLPAGVNIRGDGFYSTALIKASASTDFIVLSGASFIQDCAITAQGSPTSGTLVKMLGNKCDLINCQVTNYFVGVQVGNASTNAVSCSVEKCNFFSPRVLTGTCAVFLYNFSNVRVTGTTISGPSSGTQPDSGIRIWNGDTAYLTDTNVTLHGIGLFIDIPAGQHVYALRISGCLFDSAKTITSSSAVSSALISPAGNLYDTLISNTWFGLSSGGDGLTVQPTGAGSVDGFCASNCQFVANAAAGFAFIGAGSVKNFSVEGGYASANGVYGGRVGPGVSDFQIVGFKAANVAGRGPNARGLNVDTGASDRYVITGLRSNGSSIFNFFDGGSGTNKYVAGNVTAP